MWACKAKNNLLLMHRLKGELCIKPDSDHQIETLIDGEHVAGTVHYTGAADISVRLETHPPDWLLTLSS
jgi:hypothetical protein